MIEMLHPGYRPPTRKEIAGQLLDQVHSELIVDAKDDLADKDVTLGVDGWSNINNDAIIAFTVQKGSKIYIVHSEDNRHNADYMAELVAKKVLEIEDKFKCKISGLVTDNAGNVSKMRRIVGSKYETIIEYGCNAHQLNLLAKDLYPKDLVNKIIRCLAISRSQYATYR